MSNDRLTWRGAPGCRLPEPEAYADLCRYSDRAVIEKAGLIAPLLYGVNRSSSQQWRAFLDRNVLNVPFLVNQHLEYYCALDSRGPGAARVEGRYFEKEFTSDEARGNSVDGVRGEGIQCQTVVWYGHVPAPVTNAPKRRRWEWYNVVFQDRGFTEKVRRGV